MQNFYQRAARSAQRRTSAIDRIQSTSFARTAIFDSKRPSPLHACVTVLFVLSRNRFESIYCFQLVLRVLHRSKWHRNVENVCLTLIWRKSIRFWRKRRTKRIVMCTARHVKRNSVSRMVAKRTSKSTSRHRNTSKLNMQQHRAEPCPNSFRPNRLTQNCKKDMEGGIGTPPNVQFGFNFAIQMQHGVELH